VCLPQATSALEVFAEERQFSLLMDPGSHLVKAGSEGGYWSVVLTVQLMLHNLHSGLRKGMHHIVALSLPPRHSIAFILQGRCLTAGYDLCTLDYAALQQSMPYMRYYRCMAGPVLPAIVHSDMVLGSDVWQWLRTRCCDSAAHGASH
jgi:hypothetical protein